MITHGHEENLESQVSSSCEPLPRPTSLLWPVTASAGSFEDHYGRQQRAIGLLLSGGERSGLPTPGTWLPSVDGLVRWEASLPGLLLALCSGPAPNSDLRMLPASHSVLPGLDADGCRGDWVSSPVKCPGGTPTPSPPS